MTCCPKCRAKGERVYLVELWKDHAIEFTQDAEGNLSVWQQTEGDPYRVQGICRDCDHQWVVRVARQITDVGEAHRDSR